MAEKKLWIAINDICKSSGFLIYWFYILCHQIHSLKYQMPTTLGGKFIVIRKSELMGQNSVPFKSAHTESYRK